MSARPNILMVHCHDLGTWLNCYGVESVNSPRLDGLAEEGVLFTRHYCSAPQCSPSRASLFTGRWPHNNGVMGLTHDEFAWDLKPDERHVVQILVDNGYRAAAIGVLHETKQPASRCGYESHLKYGHASRAADETVKWLEEHAQSADKPFFLSVGFMEPHRLKAPGEHVNMGFLSEEFGPDDSKGVQVPGFLKDTPGTREELAELQGAVRHLDQHAGRILDALKQNGLEQDTLVIFTTDHGYAMPRAKCNLYDPGMAIAFILRLPARDGWSGGRRCDEMTTNLDVVPTLLDLLDIETPGNVQGKSFAALLDGGAYEPHEAVFGELTYHDYYDPRRSIRTDTHKLIANFAAAPSFMDSSQSWRPRSDTVVPFSNAQAYHRPFELYDLKADPWEQNNLAQDREHIELAKGLMARLYQHMVETEDPLLDGAVTSPLHEKTIGYLRGVD